MRIPHVTQLRVVDSHTVGEPTRIIIEGGPELGNGPIHLRAKLFREQFDHYRRAVLSEPRRLDVIVGGLLCSPSSRTYTAGIIFFDTVGYLDMCIHGTVGLVKTLAYLGRIAPGQHYIETPAGIVRTEFTEDGQVRVFNVPCYRYIKQIELNVPGRGRLFGDIAWGGNWFLLVEEHSLEINIRNIHSLLSISRSIKTTLQKSSIRGIGGAPIDYVALFGMSSTANSRSFVLCPGDAYDRSPCGTATCAKLACLAADNTFEPNMIWHQEGVTGSRFQASYEWGDSSSILPTITSSGYVNGDSFVIIDPEDPFSWGIPS